MIRAIVRWATAHAKLVIALYGAFVIGAAVVSRTLKFDALPDITTNQVLVLPARPGSRPRRSSAGSRAPSSPRWGASRG